jgi:hypothetical protein
MMNFPLISLKLLPEAEMTLKIEKLLLKLAELISGQRNLDSRMKFQDLDSEMKVPGLDLEMKLQDQDLATRDQDMDLGMNAQDLASGMRVPDKILEMKVQEVHSEKSLEGEVLTWDDLRNMIQGNKNTSYEVLLNLSFSEVI